MKTIRQLWRKYLAPKKAEFWGDRTVYNLIGIDLYKKYLPTTGDMARKKKNITQITLSGKGGRLSQLYGYERKTRNYELRHLIGAIAFVIITLLLQRELTVFDYIFLPLLNLYINIYPIFLQRYNRIRIIKVLKQYGFNSPYEN